MNKASVGDRIFLSVGNADIVIEAVKCFPSKKRVLYQTIKIGGKDKAEMILCKGFRGATDPDEVKEVLYWEQVNGEVPIDAVELKLGCD